MLRFDKTTYLSLLFMFILSVRYLSLFYLSMRIRCLLFLQFIINIVSILFYNFIEFIKLLYTFLVISFSRHKEYMICLISFSKFSGVLLGFTCARAIGNL